MEYDYTHFNHYWNKTSINIVQGWLGYVSVKYMGILKYCLFYQKRSNKTNMSMLKKSKTIKIFKNTWYFYTLSHVSVYLYMYMKR